MGGRGRVEVRDSPGALVRRRRRGRGRLDGTRRRFGRGADRRASSAHLQRTLDPARELRERATETLALRIELTRERLDVFTQSLLETVEAIDFVLGPTACFGDYLASPLLGAHGHLAGLGFGLLLGLLDELLGHDEIGRA